MIRAREHDDAVAPIGDREQALVLVGMREHGDIGAVVEQLALHVGRIADRHGEPDPGIAHRESRQHFGGVIGADRADQLAGPAALSIGEEFARLLLLREQPGGDREGRAPRASVRSGGCAVNNSTPNSRSSAATCAVRVGWLTFRRPARQ